MRDSENYQALAQTRPFLSHRLQLSSEAGSGTAPEVAAEAEGPVGGPTGEKTVPIGRGVFTGQDLANQRGGSRAPLLWQRDAPASLGGGGGSFQVPGPAVMSRPKVGTSPQPEMGLETFRRGVMIKVPERPSCYCSKTAVRATSEPQKSAWPRRGAS